MRDRPFLPANEFPRPYSDLQAERLASDLTHRMRESLKANIRMLEAEAQCASTEAERQVRQCEAEALRCRLDNR